MSETFFTADTHGGHDNIRAYCKRPYASVEEMDEALIANWNAIVRPTDTVWHLGDVGFFRDMRAGKRFLQALHGTIHLVKGNHDRKLGELASRFASIRDLTSITVNDTQRPGGKQYIVLCHYPLRSWDRSFHGSWMLHGHTHGSLPPEPGALTLDVGVDCHYYRPISYEEVRAYLINR